MGLEKGPRAAGRGRGVHPDQNPLRATELMALSLDLNFFALPDCLLKET